MEQRDTPHHIGFIQLYMLILGLLLVRISVLYLRMNENLILGIFLKVDVFYPS